MLALLLAPTAYGMITENFVLAGACVLGVIAVRLIGLRSPPNQDTAEEDEHEP